DGATGALERIAGGTPASITPLGDRLSFQRCTSGEVQLWTTDGTAAGTALVATHATSTSAVCSMAEPMPAGLGLVFFYVASGQGSDQRYTLVRSDGTAEGTFPVVTGLARSSLE